MGAEVLRGVGGDEDMHAVTGGGTQRKWLAFGQWRHQVQRVLHKDVAAS